MPHQFDEAGHDALARSGTRRLVEWLEQRLGPGRPLDDDTRRRMERFFGQTLDDVRIHDSQQAGELARRLGGEAFTIEGHVFGDPDRLRTFTPEGRGLVAHELTHVVQQTQPPPAPRASRTQPQHAPLMEAGVSQAVQAPQFARRGASASPSTGAPAEAEAQANEERMRQAAEAAEERSQESEVDAEELAERVYRLMRQELSLDRERNIQVG